MTSGGGELSVEDLVSSDGCWSEDPLSSLSTSACCEIWRGVFNFLFYGRMEGARQRHKSTRILLSDWDTNLPDLFLQLVPLRLQSPTQLRQSLVPHSNHMRLSLVVQPLCNHHQLCKRDDVIVIQYLFGGVDKCLIALFVLRSPHCHFFF